MTKAIYIKESTKDGIARRTNRFSPTSNLKTASALTAEEKLSGLKKRPIFSSFQNMLTNCWNTMNLTRSLRSLKAENMK